jgi:hypothetical protein
MFEPFGERRVRGISPELALQLECSSAETQAKWTSTLVEERRLKVSAKASSTAS